MPTRQPLDSGSGQEILIQMEGLVKNFGKLEVLKGIDLNVRKGDVIVLIAPLTCWRSPPRARSSLKATM